MHYATPIAPNPTKRMGKLSFHLALLFGFALLLAGCMPGRGDAQDAAIRDSGGPLRYEQAAYDVSWYGLDLELFPERKAIQGSLTVQATIVHPVDVLLLQLDSKLQVDSVRTSMRSLPFTHQAGWLTVQLGRTLQTRERVEVTVFYGGIPHEAVRPPWDGGFTWATTPSGQPWIATSVQGEGADLWWPVKDHPSDEPDSMHLRFTVPAPLFAASNGRLTAVDTLPNHRLRYVWHVSTPINNYGVAVHAGPYEVLEDTFTSVAGETFPLYFYVLPENRVDAERLFPQIRAHLAWFEARLGPYPFRADKYAVAHTPFLGMEHQTLIAYGSNFSDGDDGFDWLHHHELGHEWWGNLVTAWDWRDFWIHEGFCTYMQALYAEDLQGEAGYMRQMLRYRAPILNRLPLAPFETRTTDQMYFTNAARRTPNNDIYYKGAWVLHSLRYVMGDEAFFEALRRFVYPTEAEERQLTPHPARFVTTSDFITLASTVHGAPLDWFFEVYLRQPELPQLHVEERAGGMFMQWQTPNNLPFPMPVELRWSDNRVERVEVTQAGILVPFPSGQPLPEIDPRRRLLRN